MALSTIAIVGSLLLGLLGVLILLDGGVSAGVTLLGIAILAGGMGVAAIAITRRKT